MNYFPSQIPPNEFRALANKLYQYQGSTLEAEHPPIGDASNKVATTGWINSFLMGTPTLPRVSDASNPIGTGLIINVSSGQVVSPAGKNCNVSATITPIAVVASSVEWVYIRYSDCEPVVSTVIPDENIGRLIAKVTTDATSIIDIENFSTTSSWAKLHSPFFTGNPRAPHPPDDSYDHSIATTKWVIDRLNDFLNDVPDLSLPTVIKAGDLKVNVTEGIVKDELTGKECNVYPLGEAVSVRANADGNISPKEHAWIRYSDCAFLVTDSIPSATEGFRLADIESDSERITNITPLTGPLSTTLIEIISSILPEFLEQTLDEKMNDYLEEALEEVLPERLNEILPDMLKEMIPSKFIASYGGEIKYIEEDSP